MTKSINFACFSHGPPYAQPRNLMQIYTFFETVMARFKIVPTHFGADNGDREGSKYKKYRGAEHMRVLNNNFEAYESIELSYNIPDSKEAYKHGHASLHFSTSESGDWTEIGFEFHERFLEFGSNNFENLIEEFSKIWPWDYGFGLQDDVEKRPSVYILSGDPGTLSAEEIRRLNTWYQSYEPETRRKGVRDIFPYMLIGKKHLDFSISTGGIFNSSRKTLREFIKNEPHCDLKSLTPDAWLWKVDTGKTEHIRKKLLSTGFILSK